MTGFPAVSQPRGKSHDGKRTTVKMSFMHQQKSATVTRGVPNLGAFATRYP